MRVDAIIQATGFPVSEIRGPSRRRDLSKARHVAMLTAREKLKMTYGAIGRVFGQRDETTVRDAVLSMNERIREDLEAQEIYSACNAACVGEVIDPDDLPKPGRVARLDAYAESWVWTLPRLTPEKGTAEAAKRGG